MCIKGVASLKVLVGDEVVELRFFRSRRGAVALIEGGEALLKSKSTLKECASLVMGDVMGALCDAGCEVEIYVKSGGCWGEVLCRWVGSVAKDVRVLRLSSDGPEVRRLWHAMAERETFNAMRRWMSDESVAAV